MNAIILRLSHQAGFTFHELLVAMSITAVAVLGYSVSTVGALRGSQTAVNFSIAVNLAHDKMEQLKASAVTTDVDRCPVAGDLGLNAMGTPGGGFDRCWRVSDWPHGTQLKKIEVRVTWQDHERREVVLATLVYLE